MEAVAAAGVKILDGRPVLFEGAEFLLDPVDRFPVREAAGETGDVTDLIQAFAQSSVAEQEWQKVNCGAGELVQMGEEAVLITGSLLAPHRILGCAYSSNEEVVEYVNTMFPFICISVTADSLEGVLSGTAQGCGWQHLGAYVNLGLFYLFGFPMSLLRFVLKLRGKGLWMGIACGSIVQSLLLAVITFFGNWQKMYDKVRERAFGESTV